MNIFFHKRFGKKYKKLHPKLQQHIDDRILFFQKDPLHPILENHQLHGKYVGYWSINITGDYRVLYCRLSESIVEFVDIDTHSNLYK